MMLRNLRAAILTTAALAAALIAVGCGQSKPSGTANQPKDKASATASAADSGWWCIEHGVPEAECSICSSKAAAQFKAKGDWCAEHNRAESQCFICNPKRAEKYVALYEAKVGKKPPKPTE
jgi:hypothetical protein